MLGPNSNSGMPFEVVAHTVISVGVPKNRSGYAGRSHSLWYCDAMEPGVFRWYETAFHAMIAFGNDGFQPFALSPGGQDVVFALDNVMHTVQVARPFTPIDQADWGRYGIITKGMASNLQVGLGFWPGFGAAARRGARAGPGAATA